MTGKPPVGVDDFREMIEGGYDYVDKTHWISGIVDKKAKVHMITRPKRFGKSMAISMLDCFLNMKYEGNTWFDGLRISECEGMEKHRNAYPVIRLSFKGMGGSFDVFISKMRVMMSRVYSQFSDDLSGSCSEYRRRKAKAILDMDSRIYGIESSLELLTGNLHERHGVRPIVLIDDYDAPFYESCGESEESQKKLYDLLMCYYDMALKGNEDLDYAVMTGTARFVCDYYSGMMNHVDHEAEYDPFHGGLFGFDEGEVKALLERHGHPEKYDEAEEWYGGYAFYHGQSFCPASVMEYVENGFEPRCFREGYEGDGYIKGEMKHLDPYEFKYVWNLMEGGEDCCKPGSGLSWEDLSGCDIVRQLFHCGYLKADKEMKPGRYKLSIPNREMRIALEGICPEKPVDRR